MLVKRLDEIRRDINTESRPAKGLSEIKASISRDAAGRNIRKLNEVIDERPQMYKSTTSDYVPSPPRPADPVAKYVGESIGFTGTHLIKGALNVAEGAARLGELAQAVVMPSTIPSYSAGGGVADYIHDANKHFTLSKDEEAFNSRIGQHMGEATPMHLTGVDWIDNPVSNIVAGASSFAQSAYEDPSGAAHFLSGTAMEQIPQMALDYISGGAGRLRYAVPAAIEMGSNLSDAAYDQDGNRRPISAMGTLGALGAGAVSGGLERLGFDAALGVGEDIGTSTARKLANTVGAMASEGITEGAQSVVSDVGGVIGGYTRPEDVGKSASLEAIGGMASGGGMRMVREFSDTGQRIKNGIDRAIGGDIMDGFTLSERDLGMAPKSSTEQIKDHFDPTRYYQDNYTPPVKPSKETPNLVQTFDTPKGYKVEVHHNGASVWVYNSKGTRILKPDNHVGANAALDYVANLINDAQSTPASDTEPGIEQTRIPNTSANNSPEQSSTGGTSSKGTTADTGSVQPIHADKLNAPVLREISAVAPDPSAMAPYTNPDGTVNIKLLWDGMQSGAVRDVFRNMTDEEYTWLKNEIQSQLPNQDAIASEPPVTGDQLRLVADQASQKTGANITVVDNAEALPLDVKSAYRDTDQNGAFYDKESNTTFFVAEHIKQSELQQRVYGDIIARQGIRAKMGDSHDTMMDQVFDSALKRDRDSLIGSAGRTEHRSESLIDIARDDNKRRRVAEAYVVGIAGRVLNDTILGDAQVGIWRIVSSKIKGWLTKTGISNIGWSDKDIAALLSPDAEDAMRDVQANRMSDSEPPATIDDTQVNDVLPGVAKKRKTPNKLGDIIAASRKSKKSHSLESSGITGGANSKSAYTDPSGGVLKLEHLNEIKPVDFPELVKLFTALGFNISAKPLGAAVQGYFTVSDGSIVLNTSLFKNDDPDKKQAAKTLAHEIGHWIDWMPNKNIKRGNILGRLKTLSGFIHNTVFAQYGDNRIFPVEVAKKIRAHAAKSVLKKEGISLTLWRNKTRRETTIPADKIADIKARIEELYQYNLQAHANQSGYVTHQQIMDELWNLTLVWRPYDTDEASDSFNEYRKSSVELYADFLSAILTAPALAERIAPTSFRLFFEALDAKPAIKAGYIQIQDTINDGTNIYQSIARQIEGQEAERTAVLDAKKAERAEKDRIKKLRAFGVSVTEMFQDNNARVLKFQRAREKRNRSGKRIMTALSGLKSARTAINNLVGDVNDPRNVLSRMTYNHAFTYAVDKTVKDDVITPLEKAGVVITPNGADDPINTLLGAGKNDIKEVELLGLYMQNNRIVNEKYLTSESRDAMKRAKEAGVSEDSEEMQLYIQYDGAAYKPASGGVTPARAQQILDLLKERLGEDKYAVLESSVTLFQDMMYETSKRASDSGIISKTFFKDVIEPTRYAYAANRVVDFINKSEYMPTTVKGMKGSFRLTGNAFIDTYIKMQAVNTHIAYNNAKHSVVNYLLGEERGDDEKLIGKVEKKWQFGRVDFEPLKQGNGRILVMKDGNVVAYDVTDPYIADAVNGVKGQTIEALSAVLDSALVADGLFKKIWITYNVAFGLRNPIRDIAGTIKRVPGFGVRSPLLVYRFLEAAFGEGRKYVSGKDTPLIRDMLYDRAIMPPNEGIFADEPEHKFRTGITEDYFNTNKGKASIWRYAKEFNPLTLASHLAQILEVSTKIASYKTLGDMGIDGDVRSFVVREMAGTPNYLRGGSLTTITNKALVFSNIKVQALAMEKQIATNPSTSAGYWFKQMILLAPKIMAYAALAGWMGEEMRKLMKGIGSYMLRNFYVLPVGYSEGEGVYGRKVATYLLPMDEQTRLLDGILYAIIGGTGKDGLLTSLNEAVGNVGGDMAPGVSPTILLAWKWSEFVSGKQPIDTFTKRPIVDNDTYKAWTGAGDDEALKHASGQMVKWSIEQSGAWRFSTTSQDKQTLYESVASNPVAQRFLPVWKFYQTTDMGYKEDQARNEAQEEGKRAGLKLMAGEVASRLSAKFNSLQGLKDNATPIQKYMRDYLSPKDINPITGKRLSPSSPDYRRFKRLGYIDAQRILNKAAQGKAAQDNPKLKAAYMQSLSDIAEHANTGLGVVQRGGLPALNQEKNKIHVVITRELAKHSLRF